MDVSPQTVSDIDHEQRQIRRIRDPGRGDIHEVFEAPVLFSIPEVKLDLEPQPIIVHEWCVRQPQITAKQDDMGVRLSAQVGLGNEVNGITLAISCSKASSMAVIRKSSGVSVTCTLFLVLLPCGRPGRRL